MWNGLTTKLFGPISDRGVLLKLVRPRFVQTVVVGLLEEPSSLSLELGISEDSSC